MSVAAQKTQELVSLAKAGDSSALDRLHQAYAERVRWMVRFRMGKELRSKLESMDVVQDTFLQALGHLHDFTWENEGDFVRWLSRIAENELRGHLRKLHAEKRDIRREVRLAGDGSTTGGGFIGPLGPVGTTTPSVMASRKEELGKLEKAIDELKPEYKQAIVLSKIDGLSHEEVADKLGRSSEAVRKLVSRALAELVVAFRRI